MSDKACRVCGLPIVLAHCESPHCNWCRACHEARVEAGKVKKDKP